MLIYLFFIILLIGSLFNIQHVLASGLNNLALIEVLNTPACDPDWFVCNAIGKPYPLLLFSGNQEALTRARQLLRQAVRLRPEADILRLHLAETVFALTEREEAAYWMDRLSQSSILNSPLLRDDRYEHRLIAARQHASRQNWEKAVENYRLGLAWGDERTLSKDETDYLKALASLEKQKLFDHPDDPVTIYRIGKYLAEAEEWIEAETWLRLSSQEQKISQLLPNQAAWVMIYLGKIAEAHSDFDAARSAYRKAIKLDPSTRQAYVLLLDLLCMDQFSREKEELEAQLLALGPTYHLGAQAEAYQVNEPVTLDNGWTLVGYDLDEEMLEQTKNLELILWWQNQGQRSVEDGWTRVSDYLLQRQVVTNLFPNAGFEWGLDERGIPLGYDRELYGGPKGSLTIKTVLLNENPTLVVSANNSQELRNVALVSREIPVKDDGYYLMSGWIWNQGVYATMGRSCRGFPPDPISPLYITDNKDQLSEKWIHYANVSLAQPGFQPDQCELLLMNDNNSEKSAYWDNIIFIRIK